MIYNPKKAIENGYLIPPTDINIANYIQQNGVDVDCDKVFELSNDELYMCGDVKINANSTELIPVVIEFKNTTAPGWRLEKGKAYTFDSSFEVNLPANLGASLKGRSSFNRNGILINSSWYDPGYKGNAAATIYCFRDLIITKGTRIAQIIFEEGDSCSMYNGQYQAK